MQSCHSVLTCLAIVLCSTGCSNLKSSDTDGRPSADEHINEIRKYGDVLSLRNASPLSETERTARAKAIADSVRARYASIRRLGFHAEICEPPSESLQVICRMTRNSFQSDVFRGANGLGEPVFSVALHDGVITEKSRFGGALQTIEYPKPFPSGTGSCRLLEPGQPGTAYWCMVGLYCWTWLGPAPRDSTMTTFDSFTHERLASGEYLGIATLDELKCSVIAWEADVKDERFAQVFYIDPDNLLVGMDQFDANNGKLPELQRRRRFTRIEVE